MWLLTTSNVFATLSVLQTAYAHMGMSNFYVNGADQGDAICVRMNPDPSTWSYPIEDLSSSDMACGFGGTKGVDRTCEVPDGATLTFEWREYANDASKGVLDPSHKGPCAVYMKKVDSAQYDTAAGDGWFKLWDQGYDQSTDQKWCTLNLIKKKGLMTIHLPPGLVGGEYLIRPEALALHNANQGDPQYYTGCAQILLTSTGNLVPENTVSIPGDVYKADAADSFNIYVQPMKLPYPVPGPPVVQLKDGGQIVKAQIRTGAEPAGCILESGSNWCGLEVPDYTNEAGCWSSAQNCWNQATACYNNAPPTGNENCVIWESKCNDLNNQCNAKNWNGPPNKNRVLTPPKASISPPPPLGPTNGGNDLGKFQPTATVAGSLIGTTSSISFPTAYTQSRSPVAPVSQASSYTPATSSPAKPSRIPSTSLDVKPVATSIYPSSLSTPAAPVAISPSPVACKPKVITVTTTETVTITVDAPSSHLPTVTPISNYTPAPIDDDEETSITKLASKPHKPHSWPWYFTPQYHRAARQTKSARKPW